METHALMRHRCEFMSAYTARDEKPAQIKHSRLARFHEKSRGRLFDAIRALVTHETVSPEIYFDMDVHPSNLAKIDDSEKFS
jgi:hypothetical protein